MDDDMHIRFSPRELQVIQGIMSHQTLFEIALWMGISCHTLKHYCRSIRSKTEQPTTKDAVIYLQENGFITKD